MSDHSLTDDDFDSDDEPTTPDALIPDEADDIEDATEAPDEEDYDFLAFVQGVRPTRRAVTIYQRNDMREQIDTLEEKIKVAQKAGEDTSEDEELLAEAAAEIMGSGRRVIVEARSSDWMGDFRKKMKARGIDPYNKKASDEARTMMMGKYINELIAAQIVYPTTGISADSIAALAKNSETEVDQLHRAVKMVNSQRGVSPDFLQAHSESSRSGSR